MYDVVLPALRFEPVDIDIDVYADIDVHLLANCRFADSVVVLRICVYYILFFTLIVVPVARCCYIRSIRLCDSLHAT